MKKIILFFCLLVFSLTVYSQKDSEPDRIKKYIKKEKGKLGLWDKTEKTWLIQPQYTKITGVAFTTNDWDMENRILFKLWKENEFDLLRVTEKNYKDEFEIWLRDISDIKKPDIEFKYSTKDWYNFIFYKKNSKWGWFSKKLEVLRGGYYKNEENILFPPSFDTPPAVTDFAIKTFYESSFNNYILQTDSVGNIGLHSLAGFTLVKPGPYKGFKEPESIDYAKEIFIITENTNGLIGYVLNGVSVTPAYTSIKKEKNHLLNLEYYVCSLPNGREDLRNKTTLFTKEDILAMENAEKQKRIDAENAYKKKKEEEAEAKTQRLIKMCGIEFISELAKGVRNKDVNAIKNAAQNALLISGYTESEKKTNRWGDNYTELKSIEKFGFMNVPFRISKYENGEIGVYRNMAQEEINFIREELKKAAAANKGWKFMGVDDLWEYWENGEVVFWFSAREIGSGSDTNIYTKKQIRMN